MKTTINILLFGFTFIIISCKEKSEPKIVKNEAYEMPQQKLPDSIINIMTIVGKSRNEVKKILGDPTGKEKVSPSGTPCKANPCDHLFYQDGKFEIVYINGKSDWITINDVSNLEISREVIMSLGLQLTNPTLYNPSSVVRYENILGINEIMFFNNGSGNVSYIYIKANTK